MDDIASILSSYEQSAFTGREAELELFRALLPLNRTNYLRNLPETERSDLAKRIPGLLSVDRLPKVFVLNVYGMGGIGKSQLLNQFRLVAEQHEEATGELVLSATIDLQVQKGIFEFLLCLYEQLRSWMEFPHFEEGLRRRQSIEDKLLGRDDIHKGVLQMFARGAHAAIKVGASFIPGGSLLTEAINQDNVEAAMNTIYSAVGKKEGDFWMKPEEELTSYLLSDLKPATDEHRVVLIYDTYELAGGFDDWVREGLLSKLGRNTLMVIAGRRPLQGKAWQRFAPVTFQLQLQPFSHQEVKEYLRKKGIHNERVAEEMADATDGYPLTLSMFVELAAQADLSELDLTRTPERKQIIRQLLERITQNVAADLRNALRVCAVLRVITADSLAFMLDEPSVQNIEAIYNEVRRFDFVKERQDGIALHDSVWEAYNEELSKDSPIYFGQLNDKAAQFYLRNLQQKHTARRDRYMAEYMYHCIRADEVEGIKRFQEMAEEYVQLRAIGQLGAFLNDVTSYVGCLQLDSSRLWVQYYEARLLDLLLKIDLAKAGYESIIATGKAEPRLRAYTLCDLARILAGRTFTLQPGGVERALQIIDQSLHSGVEVDAKLVLNYHSQSEVYYLLGRYDEYFASLNMIKTFYESTGDTYGLVRVYQMLKSMYAVYGDWKSMIAAHNSGLKLLGNDTQSWAYSNLIGYWPPCWAWTGRYAEAEHFTKESLAIKRHLGDPDIFGLLRDLVVVLAFIGKFAESDAYCEENESIYRAAAEDWPAIQRSTYLRWLGVSRMRKGLLPQASEVLKNVVGIIEAAGWNPAMNETLTWLGLTYELQHEWELALVAYERSLGFSIGGRQYFEAGAHVGITRVLHKITKYDDLPRRLEEAQRLPTQYEYNDHLASIRLTQAQLAWEGQVSEWGTGFEAAQSYIKQALVYALRYNRFLLDEVLSGRQHGTALQPVIPYCLQRGDEGKRMLQSLLEWWQVSRNEHTDIAPRPDTISPIQESIPLLDAERIARLREPGDDTKQKSVVEQLRSALGVAL
jgi:tetratricopeptide (TPR) repeat protein